MKAKTRLLASISVLVLCYGWVFLAGWLEAEHHRREVWNGRLEGLRLEQVMLLSRKPPVLSDVAILFNNSPALQFCAMILVPLGAMGLLWGWDAVRTRGLAGLKGPM